MFVSTYWKRFRGGGWEEDPIKTEGSPSVVPTSCRRCNVEYIQAKDESDARSGWYRHLVHRVHQIQIRAAVNNYTSPLWTEGHRSLVFWNLEEYTSEILTDEEHGVLPYFNKFGPIHDAYFKWSVLSKSLVQGAGGSIGRGGAGSSCREYYGGAVGGSRDDGGATTSSSRDFRISAFILLMGSAEMTDAVIKYLDEYNAATDEDDLIKSGISEYSRVADLHTKTFHRIVGDAPEDLQYYPFAGLGDAYCVC